MARKKSEPEAGGNWMDTYGDMVTLLMTFFIALYSMATIEDEKWFQLIKAFNINGPEKVEQIIFTIQDDGEDFINNEGEANGEEQGNQEEDPDDVDFSQLYNALKAHIDINNMGESIFIEKGIAGDSNKDNEGENSNIGHGTEPGYENIYIQFSNNVLFEPDKASMLLESEPILKFMGETLKMYEEDISLVVIKGFTADAPNSTVDSRELSSMRATVISNYFEKTCGMSAETLRAMGLGKCYPVATNDNEEGRSQNRRVEIVIIPKESVEAQTGEWDAIFGSYYASKNSGDTIDILGD